MERDDLIIKKFTVIHEVIRGLELAIGMVFEPDIEPQLIPDAGLVLGELPSHNPKGLDGKKRKFYAPFIKGGKTCPDFYFYIPLEREIYGELVFQKTDNAHILFGRSNEKKPFTFSRGKKHLPLRIYRNGNTSQENWQFKPLFIRIEDDKTIRLLRMLVNWSGDRVRIRFREPDDPPSFLPLTPILK